MKQFRALAILFFILLSPSIVFAQETVPLEDQLAELQELDAQLNDISAQLDTYEGASDFVAGSITSEEVRATVTSIVMDKEIDGVRRVVFEAEADGEVYTVDSSLSFSDGLQFKVQEGSTVYLQIFREDGYVFQTLLIDVVRTGRLLWLLLFFAVVIVAVGRFRGFASLLGLGITLLILFAFVIPQILNGADPVLVTVLGSLVILAVNMHLSHGFHKATLLAFASTSVGLGLVWLFSNVFVSFSRLSGMTSEEAILLQYNADGIAAPTGILLAAIILGAVGVLDDIAITQSETVAELHEANPKMTQRELFSAAMRVGRHHIASTVNTLVLAYVGVALPLLLLFMHTQGVDLMRFLNEESVAEEIVRTLAGTLALILTVPIATWLATWGKRD